LISFRQLSPALITSEPGKSIAIGVVILMSVLFVSQLVSGLQPQQSTLTPQTPVGKGRHQDTLDTRSALFTKPLFGEYVPDMATAEIKQSTLDFTVVGILYSSQKGESQVLLQTTEGKELSFLVGDTLPGGAVIKRIEKSRIIVLYKGALESLRLPKNELLFEQPPKALSTNNSDN